MTALFLRELRLFLFSLMGYVVLVAFLVMLSLFLWILPGPSNILDAGFAGIDSLFAIVPYLFLFLVPAITMRMISEERKSGTLEMLLTKPINEFQIVWAKYLAGVVLLLVALLPGLVYVKTVYDLGAPEGNLDSGGTFGSFIGLMLLGSAFVSIGMLASALTDNQLVAFVIGVFMCFILFTGLESLGSIPFLSGVGAWLSNLSMNAHYLSLSRGVIDTRDVLYFLSLNALFLLGTRTALESRKWS
jgi:ABC-2 type transport system permease protein